MPRWPFKKVEAIFRRSGGRCFVCKRRHTLNGYGRSWNVDHLQPKSLGGSDDVRNLAVACIGCNSSKANNFGLPDIATATANEVVNRLQNGQIGQSRRSSTTMYGRRSSGRGGGGNSRGSQRKGRCALCEEFRPLKGDRCNSCIQKSRNRPIQKRNGECAFGNCVRPVKSQGFFGFGASRYCNQHQNQSDRGLI